MHVCVCVFVCLCNRSPSRRALGLCVCFPFFFSTIYSFATEPYAIGILVSCCSSTVRQKARKWQDRILRFFTVTRAKQRKVVRGKGRAASKRKKTNNTNANAHPVPCHRSQTKRQQRAGNVLRQQHHRGEVQRNVMKPSNMKLYGSSRRQQRRR